MTTAALAADEWGPAPTTPRVPGRRGGWLNRHPLLRCVAIYGQMPGRFALCFGLFVLVNGGLALQQHLVGRAIHDAELGRAVVRSGAGHLDASRGLWWVAVLVGVAAVRAALQYAAGLLALTIGQELLSRLREDILLQVQRLDLAYHARHGVGEMVTRTTRDADKVRDALISVWRNVIETALVVGGALALIAWYAPSLAAGPVLAVAAGLTWLLRNAEPLVALDRAVGAAFDRVNQDLTEGVHGVRVIKAFALEDVRTARFAEAVRAFVDNARIALRFAARHIPGPQIIVALGQVWVLGWGALLVSRGRLDVGALVASLLMMNTVVFRVEGVGRVLQVFTDARSSAARMMELLDAEPALVGGDVPVPIGPLGVRVRNVRVRAPGGDTDALVGASLTVAPGEVVALVGATGSGKSTLTALLPRLVDPLAGDVAVGSDRGGWRDVRELDLTQLRRRVHVVPQEVFLFSDTIAANLRLGAPDATDEELWRALRLAAADDVVAALPEGLATVVGDRGVTLSGGQRQRLTLARALAARPSVLVLDDATSALDALTERTVLENLRRLGDGENPITVLIVASKLSTVLLADRAALLVGGSVVAHGHHEDLLDAHAAYRELLAS